MKSITTKNLEEFTGVDGEGWALPHVQRILRLADDIGSGLTYDTHAFTVAAYLHDWGAFPRYRQPGVAHALRSRQIAETEIVPCMDLTTEQTTIILEAIERHDYRDTRSLLSTEALLLREADILDFLGVIGFAREFAWGPNNLALCYQRIQKRYAALRDNLTLPRAQAIAVERMARMEQCLAWIEEESLGYL